MLARPGSVASHRTAAWIHGLLRYRPGTFHLTAPTRQRLKRDFVVHYARLEPEDHLIVDGIPVTSPARTVLDLAPEESRRGLDRLLTWADDREALDRRWFEALTASAGGHLGRAAVERSPSRSTLDAGDAASAGGAPMGDPRGAQAALPPSTVGEIGATGPAVATHGPFPGQPAASAPAATAAAHLERRRAAGPRRSVA